MLSGWGGQYKLLGMVSINCCLGDQDDLLMRCLDGLLTGGQNVCCLGGCQNDSVVWGVRIMCCLGGGQDDLLSGGSG